MSFLIKSKSVNFSKISTQAVKAASEPKISFTDETGLSLTKNLAGDLFTSAEVLKASNGSILKFDKSSTYEFNSFELQNSFLYKIVPNYDPSSLAHAFPRFKPFENLTGITTTRPEVVMSMTYKPLFFDDRKGKIDSQKLTNEGELIDAQIQLFNLKYEAFSKLILDMKQNAEAQKMLVDNEDQFLSHIEKLTSQTNFLRSIVLTFENLKSFLNLRSNRSKIDFSKIIYNYFKTITIDLKSDVTSRFESDTNFFKILGDCGFSEENSKNFSNTKIYLQSLYELKKLLVCASDEMTGVDGSQKLTDSDPTSIIKTKLVDINKEIALNIQRFTNVEMRALQSENYQSFISKISASVKYLDTIQAATPDDRVAMFYHLVSKEYSYSYSFADAAFNNFVEQTYGYKANQTNNLQMFDTFIGHPGNRIVDSVYSLSPNASMAISQQDKGDFLVLPFENDYIDYDSSIFSPGNSYYIDDSFKVDQNGLKVDRINELRVLAENQTKYQSTLYKFLIPRLQNTFNNDTAYGEKISNSSSLFNMCMSTFIDPSTQALKPAFVNSNIGVIFEKANSDSYLKSLLFTYFYVKTLGSSNDSSFLQGSRGIIEFVAGEISKRLQNTTQSNSKIYANTKANSSGGVQSQIASSIENDLKSSNEFISVFSSQLAALYDTFQFSGCFNGDVTRYSGMKTSTLFLMIFEMLFMTFCRLNDKKVIGFTPIVSVSPSVETNTRGSELFQVKSFSSFILSRTNFSEIINSKLKFENDLTLKLILMHLNVFDSLQNAIRNSIVFLQKSESVKALNDILKTVQSNENLSLLINEPQINLVKNAIDDINSKYDARVRENYKKENNKLDVAAAYLKNEKNDLVLFEDFLLSDETKKFLYNYFSCERFSINKSFNSRILSVGIPQGFSNFLKEKVSLSNVSNSTLSSKESDIVKVNVYKVDVRHQNLVFKPQSFLFELSRFVSKDFSSYMETQEGMSESEFMESIPIRDYSTISDVNQTESVTFGKSSSLYKSNEYDFLNDQQKDDMMKNHIRSHMLELYVRLLTGFSLNEMDFLIDETSNKISSMSTIIVNKLIDENVVQTLLAPPFKGPMSTFLGTKSVSAAITAKTSPPLAVKFKTNNVTKNVSSFINPKLSQVFESKNGTITDMSKVRTLYSDGLYEARKLLKPKVFDRIFNLFVDPDDFEIDHKETIKTDSGKDTLESLYAAGKVVEIKKQSIMRSDEFNEFLQLKLLDKNPKENDAVFEKYFITLETVLGDVV